MNLLVTNTRNIQAYSIIRALRPAARKIVATISGKNPASKWMCHAAYSRYVERRYRVPQVADDWRKGNIRPHNTPGEARYMDRILDICAREAIDTIFPSSDAEVYVFSKNRQRLAERGILVPVPGYDKMLVPIDKYRTYLLAREAGFPCPETHLLDRAEDLARVADKTGPPWVIRPRFTVAGIGMEIVADYPRLAAHAAAIGHRYGVPMIQEFIPGKQRQSFFLCLDKKGTLIEALCPQCWRISHRTHVNTPAGYRSETQHPWLAAATSMLNALGWWGPAAVQTKIDARDGLPKLTEINPRLGMRLWYRTELGINSPLITLKIARGEPLAPLSGVPRGTYMLDPIDDVLNIGIDLLDRSIFLWRTEIMKTKPLDPFNIPPPVKDILKSYLKGYTAKEDRIYNPHFRHFFEDPLPSLLFFIQSAVWTAKTRRMYLGK